jgi:hypothetical protein
MQFWVTNEIGSLISVYNIYFMGTENILKYEYTKCSILYEYKNDGLQLTICTCYSKETALNISLIVLFNNIQNWKGYRSKQGK